MKCPYKFKLKYIDHVKPTFEETIELFLGKRVHETLKKLYQNVQRQKRILLDELLEYLYSRWHRRWHSNIRIVKHNYDLKDYQRFAERYIKGYYHSHKPFNNSRTIAIEKQLISNLKNRYRFCCYIDRISKTENGFYEIHDYKTSSRIPNKEYFQGNIQLPLYALLLRKRFPYIKKIKLVWHYLKFNKEICVHVNIKQLEKLETHILDLVETIEQTSFFPAKPSKLCNWRKYQSICKQES